MTLQAAIAAEVHRARLAQPSRVTIETVAERVGVSTSTLHAYEQGRSPVPSHVLVTLAEAYGASLDEWARVARTNAAPKRGRPRREVSSAVAAEATS